MADIEETNVRLPDCAHAALDMVRQARGISRDEAVRQVLAAHVASQEILQDCDQLTHIASVLRYPSPAHRGAPVPGRPLRLRLPRGLTARARAVAFRLPGQSVRSHADYQARLLTDAMMTAIAVHERLSDEFLDGLLPLLRRDAALGLWHLAAAATSTFPENVIRDAADVARDAEMPADHRQVLRAAEALEEVVAWHSPERFLVAENLARDLLTGPRSAANEQMLYEQLRQVWGALCDRLRTDPAARAPYLRGVPDLNLSGRGGAAVWRAHRRVESQDFEDWLARTAGPASSERFVRPPGWRVRVPAGWRARIWPGADCIPEPYAAWVRDRRLLVFPIDEKLVTWPLAYDGDGGLIPVAGIEALASAAGLRPGQISGFIEAMLVDWSVKGYHPELPVNPVLPARTAFRLGLIGKDERDRCLEEARMATLRKMQDVVGGLPDPWEHRAEFQRAIGNRREFMRLARRHRVWFEVVKPTWSWPVRSVASELVEGARADAVRWLAGWALETSDRLLQRSMEHAWNAAIEGRPKSYWLPVPPGRPGL